MSLNPIKPMLSVRCFIDALRLRILYSGLTVLLLTPGYTANASPNYPNTSPLQISVGLYDMYPYSYKENGQIKGEWIDLFNLLLKDTNISHSFTMLPAKRLLLYLRTGEIQLTLAPSRHQDISPSTVIQGQQRVTALTSGIISKSPLTMSTETILKQEQLLSVRGFSYNDIIQDITSNNIQPVSSYIQMARLIISGRYRYGIGYKNELLALPIRDQQQIHFSKVHTSNMIFVVSRKLATAQHISEILDKKFLHLLQKKQLISCCARLLSSLETNSHDAPASR